MLIFVLLHVTFEYLVPENLIVSPPSSSMSTPLLTCLPSLPPGLVVPDVPLEETGQLRALATSHGLELVRGGGGGKEEGGGIGKEKEVVEEKRAIQPSTQPPSHPATQPATQPPSHPASRPPSHPAT